MSDTDGNQVVYLISYPISLEKDEKMRDLNSYTDDIKPAMLQKIASLRPVDNEGTTSLNNGSVQLQVDDNESVADDIKFESAILRKIASQRPVEDDGTTISHDMGQLVTNKRRKLVCQLSEESDRSKVDCLTDSLSNLKQKSHLRKHAGEKPYTCEICGKSFKRKDYLKTHMRVHTGERPFKCDLCNKQFKQSIALKIHRRIHTGETPFKCNVCGKQFKDKSNFNTHMRIHTDERHYECEVCGKQFKRNSDLKTHLKIHTGERPYKCDLCNKQFNQRSSLNRHTRIHSIEKL